MMYHIIGLSYSGIGSQIQNVGVETRAILGNRHATRA